MSIRCSKKLHAFDVLTQEKWDRSVRAQVVTSIISPPASIHPKNSKLGLLDIDTLELARQLTILASLQYMSVKPMECLERSSEVQVDYNNSISRITRHFNQVGISRIG
jgi:son of sevenless-like protein